MCIWIYVLMCVHVCKYTCIYVFVCMCVSILVYMYLFVCVRICKYTCICVFMCVHVCKYTCICECGGIACNFLNHSPSPLQQVTTFFFYIYLCMCVSVGCMCAAHVWRPEDNSQELALFLLCGCWGSNSGHHIRLGGKRLYLLSHLACLYLSIQAISH